MVKILFIFISAVLIILLGLQPAIAEKVPCISIPPEDKTASDTANSNQYREGITDYYKDNKRHNCKEVLLHIESYKPVKQKRKKIPIISLHDKTKGSEDDPYQFFLMPDVNKFTDAAILYMEKRLGGREKFKDKIIMTLSSPDYDDNEYLNRLSKEYDFIHDSKKFSDKNLWSYISERDPTFVFLRGEGINIPLAIENATNFYYPVSKLIGDTWEGHDEYLIDLGEIADGYQKLSVINATTGQSPNNKGDANSSNSIYWELGRLAAAVSLAAIDFAEEEFGAELNRGQVRWALENLDLSEGDLEGGIKNLVSSIEMDCNNRNILRKIYIQKWDADEDEDKWDTIYDFIDENDEDKGEECMPNELKVILDRSNKQQKSDELTKLLEEEIKTLGYAYLPNITLTTEKNLTGADLTGANLTEVDLTGVDLTGVDLTEANLSNTTLTGVDLTEVDLTGANLTGANLTGVDLTGVDLTGANLTGANLTGVDLTEVDLTEVDLTEVDLTGANLINKILTAVNFYDVKNEKNQNETIYMAKLEDKNRLNTSNTKVTFDDKDKIVIRLMTAFIKDYTKGPWSIINDALSEGQLRSGREIAVLAAVEPLGQGFDFEEDAHKRAQVVFYSNDVVAGQFLNFNNMLIYGPNSEGIKNGIGFALWIIEIDARTPKVGALLGKLAQSFSGSDALGSRETSDINFPYQVSFVPSTNNNMASPPALPLAIGNYVFIRAPKTRGIKDINWVELQLDENTGRLYKCPENNDKSSDDEESSEEPKPAANKKGENNQLNVRTGQISPLTTEEGCIKYRENNYLVIQISRNNTAVNRKDVNETFESFINAMENNKGYNQVTAGIAKLKRQSLLGYISNYRQRGTDSKKCRSEKVKIANEFKTYWDTYIRQSFIQYLKGVTNDIVLNQEQLGEVLTELSSAINAVTVHTDTTAQYFVLPGPGQNTDVVDQKRDNIKKLILNFKCPWSSSKK